jgi:hypothetical protein
LHASAVEHEGRLVGPVARAQHMGAAIGHSAAERQITCMHMAAGAHLIEGGPGLGMKGDGTRQHTLPDAQSSGPSHEVRIPAPP